MGVGRNVSRRQRSFGLIDMIYRACMSSKRHDSCSGFGQISCSSRTYTDDVGALEGVGCKPIEFLSPGRVPQSLQKALNPVEGSAGM